MGNIDGAFVLVAIVAAIVAGFVAFVPPSVVAKVLVKRRTSQRRASSLTIYDKRDQELEMAIQDRYLREAGLLDPDEPTPYSHLQHLRRTRAEFTALERSLIRHELGL